ncbi:MAG: hypothetical protein JXR27_03750 [Paludibacteraceae bacterium]|nr:hypothetical protein [Paludibacteraceae bacterium]
MKKAIYVMLLLALFAGLRAQQQGKVRVGFNGGVDVPGGGVGLGGDLDIRYNLQDNLNLGIKFAGDVMMKDMYVDKINLEASATGTAMSSTMVTGDYYFNEGVSLFAPFVGGGMGFYKIANLRTTVSGVQIPDPPTDFSAFSASYKFAVLLRGGFELGHVRLGVEYNIIPKSNVYEVLDGSVGITSNSFVKFSLGFYLGGGKWLKQ